jgi:hypothetical protein
LAGQDIDLSEVNKIVEHQRGSTLKIDANKFSMRHAEDRAPQQAAPVVVEKVEEPKKATPAPVALATKKKGQPAPRKKR